MGLGAVSAPLLVLGFVPWVATAGSSIMAVADVCLPAGALVAFTAFVMAVLAKVRHERWALLWIPLTMFPAVVTLPPAVLTFWMMGSPP